MNYYSISYGVRCFIARSMLFLAIAASDALGDEISAEVLADVVSTDKYYLHVPEIPIGFSVYTQSNAAFEVSDMDLGSVAIQSGWSSRCCGNVQSSINQIDQVVATWNIKALDATQSPWHIGLGVNDDLYNVQQSIDGSRSGMNLLLFYKNDW